MVLVKLVLVQLVLQNCWSAAASSLLWWRWWWRSSSPPLLIGSSGFHFRVICHHLCFSLLLKLCENMKTTDLLHVSIMYSVCFILWRTTDRQSAHRTSHFWQEMSEIFHTDRNWMNSGFCHIYHPQTKTRSDVESQQWWRSSDFFDLSKRSNISV